MCFLHRLDNDAESQPTDIAQPLFARALNMLVPAMQFLADRGYTARSTCLDIGANIGNHTVFFSKFFQKVFAVEANPSVFELLEINTRAGSAITVRNCAVGAHSGTAQIRVPDPGNEGTGSVLAQRGDVACAVEMDRLDVIARDFSDDVGLIKIDVEGMEQDVLMGADEVIRRNSPAIFLEYHRHLQGEVDTLDLLRERYGYTDFYYVCPAVDLQGSDSALRNVAHVVLNTVLNSRFHVRPVAFPVKRSYDFVIALKSPKGS